MAQRLVNALGRGPNKTGTEKTTKAQRSTAQGKPSVDSFYKLGMGIGPFIRNTVQSYKGEGSPNEATSSQANVNKGFIKDNVVSQKNIANQLSALTSIMGDIRKISLAQLNLQRSTASRMRGIGDRSGYLSQEQALEGKGRGAPVATLSGIGGGGGTGSSGSMLGSLLSFMGNNPLLTAGVLGSIYAFFKKDIDRFLKESGVSKLLTDVYNKVREEVVNSVKAGISSVAESVKQQFEDFKKDPTSAITPAATLGGAVAGRVIAGKIPLLRRLPGFKLGATVLGGFLGYNEGASVEQLVRDANMEAKTPEQIAAKQAAQAKLGEMGLDLAGGAVSLYGAKRAYDIGKGLITGKPSPGVTPTAPPSAMTPAPPPNKVPGPFDHLEGKKLTPHGTVGDNREMAKNKSIFQKAIGSIAEYAIKTKEMMVKIYASLAKAISKIGIQKVAAYIAMRAGVAASGLAGGPVVIVTTVLSVGWTIYDLYGFVNDLIKDIDGDGSTTPARDPNGAYRGDRSNSTTPGANPQTNPSATQSPGSSTLTSPIAGRDALSPSSGYGMRKDPITGENTMHKGFDYPAALGTPINAINDGEVIEVGDDDPGKKNKGLGKFVKLMHEDGTISVYGHMSEQSAIKGKRIKKGDVIGKVGSTGRSTGPHLHLEILKPNEKGKFTQTDPGKYFNNIPSTNNSKTSSVSGAENTAPGAPSANDPNGLGSAFASAFNFDPTKFGVDMSQFKGEGLENLQKIQSQMNMALAATPPAAPAAPSNPAPAAAPAKTTTSTVAREKDMAYVTFTQGSGLVGTMHGFG